MGTKKKYFSYRIVGVVLVLALLIIGGGIFIYKNNNQLVCGSDVGLINQASTAIKNNDSKNLLTIVNTIFKKNKFSNDPNCDFIVMTYYINISDGKNAQTSYGQLVKTYDSKIGLNTKLKPLALPLGTYKGIIDYLINQSNQPIKRSLPALDISK